MGFLAAMTVVGILPQLQCDNGQLVCPLQNITCQCVVTGEFLSIRWRLRSEFIAAFDFNGQCGLMSTNCADATVEVLASGLSSNVSFVADLQPGPLTIECQESYTLASSKLFSIGMSFKNFTQLSSTKYQVVYVHAYLFENI